MWSAVGCYQLYLTSPAWKLQSNRYYSYIGHLQVLPASSNCGQFTWSQINREKYNLYLYNNLHNRWFGHSGGHWKLIRTLIGDIGSLSSCSDATKSKCQKSTTTPPPPLPAAWKVNFWIPSPTPQFLSSQEILPNVPVLLRVVQCQLHKCCILHLCIRSPSHQGISPPMNLPPRNHLATKHQGKDKVE